MLLPFLLFPWSFYRPFYSAIREMVFDSALKVMIGWLLATLLIFSLISGKQVHYLMPEIAAFSVVFVRILRNAISRKTSTKLIGYSYLLYGVTLAALPFIVSKEKAKITFEPDIAAFVISGVLIIVAGIYFIRKEFTGQNSAIRSVALGSVLVVFATHLPVHNFLAQQDISRFAKSIAALQAKEIPVLHYKKYHDQYQFAGRLHHPLVVVYDQQEISDYVAKYPDAMIVVYVKQKNMHKVNQSYILEKTDFKGKYALLIKAKDYQAFYSPEVKK